MIFEVTGKVVGKQRVRVTKSGHAYTPDKTREKERQIAEAYKESGGKMLKGPVAVYVDTFRQIPKSKPKKLTCEPDTYKPDADNILKLVLDALNGVAYSDDSQVIMCGVTKYPRTRTEEHMTVSVSEVRQKTHTL